MKRLRMAVIGVGHLGKEHARILAGLPEVELVGVADCNGDQARAVARRLGTQAYDTFWPLLNLVEAASIVVPTSQHGAVASEFLSRGLPVLVEKPLAPTAREAEALARLAQQTGTILQVGHIERFNPAFLELQQRSLQPRYVRCERQGSFTGRSTDIGVVLDLMIHDLDLLLALIPAPVRTVEALGVSIFGNNEDVANARLHFANGCVADLTASRASFTPGRHMHLWAPEGYARVDFIQRQLTLVQPTPELRRHGLDPARLDPAMRARLGDVLFEHFLQRIDIAAPPQDQLTSELRQFVHCVRTGNSPWVGAQEGCQAIVVAERILHSLRSHAWNGEEPGPLGPLQVPPPAGPLFASEQRKEAA